MTLEEKINADIKTAMLAKDQPKLESLRAIKAAIILLKTSAEGHSEANEIKTLQKMVKQRRETADIYKTQGRNDLAEVELFQAGIIEVYLPKQLTEEEIKSELQQLIAKVGASSAADMGKVMGAASKHFAGRADNKIVSEILRQILK